MDSEKLKNALDVIDNFNSQDPRMDNIDGNQVPKELSYSKQLTSWVLKLNPDASEALRVAARGQHIGRWAIPRDEYEMNRKGYLKWREALKSYHAEKVCEILNNVGYDEEFIQSVRQIILKKNLKQNPDVQTLEDALCLLFLDTQFMELKEKITEAKLKDIVLKTWKKMSPQGHEMALKINYPAEAKEFLLNTLPL